MLTHARRFHDARRPRVLIVNCYFPEVREPVRLPFEVPNALAPVFLAGAFAGERCEIRLYNEIHSGFLELYAPELLGWADVLVLTGLALAYDRFLHLTAYARSQNPGVTVIAGGSGVRALPRYSRRFFDHVAVGDVEQMPAIVAEVLGSDYANAEIVPRYDLAYWMGKRIGYVESSRNCNFRCGFCSLTAEGHPYLERGTDALRRQIEALGKRELLFFQDNQFYNGNRTFFRERMELLAEMRRRGHFKYWHAFVTSNFLWDDENLELARATGCISVFVGVESFDEVWLRRMDKKQNTHRSQLELIRRCLEAGILFQYGLIFDPTARRLADMHREIAFICDNPEIPLPIYVFGAIPLPGTPFFYDSLERGLFLPSTKMRDMQGSTLSLHPLDGIEDVAHFLRTAKNFVGYRARTLRHQLGFFRRWGRRLSPWQLAATAVTSASILAPWAVAGPRTLLRRQRARTHVSTTDRLDDVYRPRLRVDPAYQDHFQPTLLTDAAGALNEQLAEDLLDQRWERFKVAQ